MLSKCAGYWVVDVYIKAIECYLASIQQSLLLNSYCGDPFFMLIVFYARRWCQACQRIYLDPPIPAIH